MSTTDDFRAAIGRASHATKLDRLDTIGKKAGAVAAIIGAVGTVWVAFRLIDRTVAAPDSLNAHVMEFRSFVGEDEAAFREQVAGALEALKTDIVEGDKHAEADRHQIGTVLQWLVWKEQRDACRQDRMAGGLDRETALTVCEAEHPPPGMERQ